MSPEFYAAACRGRPCPDGCPPEPYHIMSITYAAFRAGRLEASTGEIIRAFIDRWDTLTESEKQSLRDFAGAFEG